MRVEYLLLVLYFTVSPTARAQLFILEDTYAGSDFLEKWTYETFDDPTHGDVNYLDQSPASNESILYVNSNNQFFMGADSTHTVPPGARGRDSVRITSNKAYNDSIIVLDLQHMPEGCGTWPAFWTVSQSGPWPEGGEIDIIEGKSFCVNLQSSNLASLHTTSECNMTFERTQTGTTVSTDCDASVDDNQGCGTSFVNSNSYGSKFNKNSGGYYAMQKTNETGVNVWFWTRELVPPAVSNRDKAITPDDSWGTPDATFPTTTCDYGKHFNAHQIVFDLTFCGDWAGSDFPSSACGPGSCVDYVNNNPSAFDNAYWIINELLVYTRQDSA